MSIRREDLAPSFTQIENEKERESLVKEIQKLKPKVEVSVEGAKDIAHGRIIEWNTGRRLFTIKWEKKSPLFAETTDSQTGLRVYVKARLFSTQLIFKTTTARRLEDGTYHYRLPTELYKQQRRGALRVPIKRGKVRFKSTEGSFSVIDLSIGGAKLRWPGGSPISKLSECELNLDGYRIKTAEFEASVTYRDEESIGIRFSGLNEKIHAEIKHFLMEALRTYYEEEL